MTLLHRAPLPRHPIHRQSAATVTRPRTTKLGPVRGAPRQTTPDSSSYPRRPPPQHVATARGFRRDACLSVRHRFPPHWAWGADVRSPRTQPPDHAPVLTRTRSSAFLGTSHARPDADRHHFVLSAPPPPPPHRRRHACVLRCAVLGTRRLPHCCLTVAVRTSFAACNRVVAEVPHTRSTGPARACRRASPDAAWIFVAVRFGRFPLVEVLSF